MEIPPELTRIQINPKTWIFVKNPVDARERYLNRLSGNEKSITKKQKKKDISELEESLRQSMENVALCPDSKNFTSNLRTKQRRLERRMKE